MIYSLMTTHIYYVKKIINYSLFIILILLMYTLTHVRTNSIFLYNLHLNNNFHNCKEQFYLVDLEYTKLLHFDEL
jgi:hypothetical protein